jgi:AraC-like DNA-binding protein
MSIETTPNSREGIETWKSRELARNLLPRDRPSIYRHRTRRPSVSGTRSSTHDRRKGSVRARCSDAAIRLMECLAKPGDAELLAPLIVDEILIRLLRCPIGVRVAQMGFAESSVDRIAKAVSWLRTNFSQPMKVEDLAELVHMNMSVSSFHEHFKSVTSLSPLHYQKVLRLQEARRLMFSSTMDAGMASESAWATSVLRSSAANTAASSGTPRPKTSPVCVKTLDFGPDAPSFRAAKVRSFFYSRKCTSCDQQPLLRIWKKQNGTCLNVLVRESHWSQISPRVAAY